MESVEEREQFLASLVDSFSHRWPHLCDKPEENPTSAIRALWFAAAGQTRSVQKAMDGELPLLPPSMHARLNQLIEQRLSGVPLAHLLGWQCFMGLEFKAGPQALIPRQETEILGHAALKRLNEIVRTRSPVRVMDICTGSGNLAIALAAHEPACQVVASDLCVDAVALARQNAEFHQLQQRLEFRVGDLFAPFSQGNFDRMADLIVCNPPYLSTAKVSVLPREIGEFEPRAAFDAGSFGLAILTRLIGESPRYLKPGSWLCFEVGLGQGPFFAARLQKTGAYQIVEPVLDRAGEVRALAARTH